MNASATLDAVSSLGNVEIQVHVFISRHTTAAGFVVLLYDFFLTLPDEVSFNYMSGYVRIFRYAHLFHRSCLGSSRLAWLSHLP